MNNNQKHKRNWKNTAKKCTAAFLAAALTAGVCGDYGTTRLMAQEKTLPGIEQIVTEYRNAGKTFHILEIVPDMEAASIGYLIGGEEPLAGGKKLSEIPSASERNDTMKNVKFPDYLGEDALFSYAEYVEAADGSNVLDIRGQFVPKEDGSGEYKYNITNAVYRMLADAEAGDGTGLGRYDRYLYFDPADENTPSDKRVVLTLAPLSGYTDFPTAKISSEGEVGYVNNYMYVPGEEIQVKGISVGEGFDPDSYVGKEIYIKGSASGMNGVYNTYQYYGKVMKGKDVLDESELTDTVIQDAGAGQTGNAGSAAGNTSMESAGSMGGPGTDESTGSMESTGVNESSGSGESADFKESGDSLDSVSSNDAARIAEGAENDEDTKDTGSSETGADSDTAAASGDAAKQDTVDNAVPAGSGTAGAEGTTTATEPADDVDSGESTDTTVPAAPAATTEPAAEPVATTEPAATEPVATTEPTATTASTEPVTPSGIRVPAEDLYIVTADGENPIWISCTKNENGEGYSYNVESERGESEYFIEFQATDGNGGDYCISAVTYSENGNFELRDEYSRNDAGRYVLIQQGEITVVRRDDSGFAEMEGGTYEFIGDYSKEPVETIRYNGGISNKEWFKSNVLNLTKDGEGELSMRAAAFDETDDFSMEVTTLTLGQMTDLIEHETYYGIDLEDVDLIYFSGQGTYDYAGIDPNALQSTAVKLAEMAFGVQADGTLNLQARVPVIMDYGFYSGAEGNASLSNLTRLLLQADNDVVAAAFAESGDMAAALAAGVDIGDRKQHLAGNVYLNDDTFLPYAAYDYLTEMTGEAAVLFEAVKKEIENENFLSSQNGQEQMDTAITKASITRYILNWSRQRTTVKDSLRVLDLEPCYDFDGLDALDEARIKRYMNQPDYTGDISITQMASAEFIGKIEDLNERYDLIYVGDRVGRMNTDNNGVTQYNDKNMNGLIYTHVGDIYSYQNESAVDKQRLLDDSRNIDNTYRGPGNDMNSTREEEFEQYIKAGYPVIFAEQLLENINDNNVRVNKARVDCNSYFYKLINFALSKDEKGEYLYWQKNVYADSQLMGTDAATRARQEAFCKYLNLSKLNIEWVTNLGEEYMPVEYDESRDWSSRYLRANGGHYYLQYIFSLENNAAASMVTTTYDCKLYIDNNADGRFSGSDYSDNRNSDASEELRGVSIYVRGQNGWEAVEQKEHQGVLRYELTVGQTYKLVRQVPDDYQGMLPWKLVFYDNTDVLVRTSKMGYTAINRDEKVKISVLQLMSDKSQSAPKYNWNLQEDEDVKVLLENVPGFDVTISSQKTSSFIKSYVTTKGDIPSNASKETKEEYYQDYYNKAYAKISQYDMIILGFGDNYQFGANTDSETIRYANEAAAEAIRDYIRDGRSVLFAHDSSSYINSRSSEWNADTGKRNSWYWGYEFNKVLRAEVGLDRYGALIDYYKQKSEDNSLSEDARERYRSYYNVLLDTNEYQFDELLQPGDEQRTQLPQKEGLTKYTVVRYMTKHLKSLVDNKGTKSQISGEGYFYFPVDNELMYRSVYKVLDKSGNPANALFGTYENYKSNSSDLGPSLTATMVNEGQITNYPFKISDDELRTLEVVNTHYQWMQPNMELDRDHDGKNDIVVWYCLSDMSAAGTSKKRADKDDGFAENIYSLSPNDVVNSYYIYSMGNVTYSGAGHTQPDSMAEKKLFVNTMVAAYSAGVKAPGVAFRNESGDNITSLYMMYDADNHKILNGQDYLDVKFQAVDYNILSGLTGIRVEFFAQAQENTPGAIEVAGIAGFVVPLDSSRLTVRSVSGEVIPAQAVNSDNSMDDYFRGSFYHVQSDGVYTLSISRDLLGLFSGGENAYLNDSASAGRIYVRATTMYDGGRRRTDSSTGELSISAAELFDLK